MTFALEAGAVATFSGPVSATPPVTLITAAGATLRLKGSATFPFGVSIEVDPDASWESSDDMKLGACITGHGTLNMNHGCLRSSSPAGEICPKEAHCVFQTNTLQRRAPDAPGSLLPVAASGAREGSCISAAVIGNTPILDSCGTLEGGVVLRTGSIYVLPVCSADAGGHLSVTGSMTWEPGVRVEIASLTQFEASTDSHSVQSLVVKGVASLVFLEDITVVQGTRTYGILAYNSLDGSSAPVVECGCPANGEMTCTCTPIFGSSALTIEVTCKAASTRASDVVSDNGGTVVAGWVVAVAVVAGALVVLAVVGLGLYWWRRNRYPEMTYMEPPLSIVPDNRVVGYSAHPSLAGSRPSLAYWNDEADLPFGDTVSESPAILYDEEYLGVMDPPHSPQTPVSVGLDSNPPQHLDDLAMICVAPPSSPMPPNSLHR